MEPPQPMRAQGFGLAALRSVGALVLREMSTRYGRRPGGYVWALIQPLGTIILLAFAFSLLQKSPPLGTSFLLFKATGMLVIQVFTGLGNSVGQSLSYSKALLFYPRVSWIDAVIARFLLNTLVLLCVVVIILSGIMIFEGIRTVLDWPKIIVSAAMTAALGLGVGCFNCYLFMRYPVWQNIWGIVTAPLFLISGIVFLYEDLPLLAQKVLWYNPLLHLTGLLRDGFYPVYTPSYISLSYVGAWILIPMVTGLLLLRQFNRDLINR
ncbi:ABC transporter permease [Sulfitobacter sp. R18_2]|uniref:ABC transporter permease n=1 Tax=Sulfitobacter sp. R18_2 TaxID=2821105 RepID=UPI001ADD01D3|nr:ABC transporter permease [Sulfitobacter sp. R18_2]MBO9440140.1 ABC transporter permease [Sulfitobacter sp. R18_2]